jgi:hypothetical protein
VIHLSSPLSPLVLLNASIQEVESEGGDTVALIPRCVDPDERQRYEDLAEAEVASVVGNAPTEKPNARYIEFHRRALRHAELALRLDPNNSYVCMMLAWVLGSLAVLRSRREQILDAHRVLALFARATLLDDTNAIAHHGVGAMHHHLLELGSLRTALTGLLYATPPEADAAVCEWHLRRCAELEPGNVFNALLLGNFLAKKRFPSGGDAHARPHPQRMPLAAVSAAAVMAGGSVDGIPHVAPPEAHDRLLHPNYATPTPSAIFRSGKIAVVNATAAAGAAALRMPTVTFTASATTCTAGGALDATPAFASFYRPDAFWDGVVRANPVNGCFAMGMEHQVASKGDRTSPDQRDTESNATDLSAAIAAAAALESSRVVSGARDGTAAEDELGMTTLTLTSLSPTTALVRGAADDGGVADSGSVDNTADITSAGVSVRCGGGVSTLLVDSDHPGRLAVASGCGATAAVATPVATLANMGLLGVVLDGYGDLSTVDGRSTAAATVGGRDGMGITLQHQHHTTTIGTTGRPSPQFTFPVSALASATTLNNSELWRQVRPTAVVAPASAGSRFSPVHGGPAAQRDGESNVFLGATPPSQPYTLQPQQQKLTDREAAQVEAIAVYREGLRGAVCASRFMLYNRSLLEHALEELIQRSG